MRRRFSSHSRARLGLKNIPQNGDGIPPRIVLLSQRDRGGREEKLRGDRGGKNTEASLTGDEIASVIRARIADGQLSFARLLPVAQNSRPCPTNSTYIKKCDV
jgi:hypothetical protein